MVMAPSSKHTATRQNSRAGRGGRKQANVPDRQVPLITNVAKEDEDSMDVDTVGPMIRIKTSDGKRITLTESDILCSNTLKRMLESSNGGVGDQQGISSNQSDYILLERVNSAILDEILDWSRHYCQDKTNVIAFDHRTSFKTDSNVCPVDCPSSDDNASLGGCPRGNEDFELTDRDKTYMSLFPEKNLLELMHASNFLDVRCLFSACCRTIARRWEGKKVEEIRRMYNIRGDFGLDEEGQMIQENRKLGLNERFLGVQSMEPINTATTTTAGHTPTTSILVGGNYHYERGVESLAPLSQHHLALSDANQSLFQSQQISQTQLQQQQQQQPQPQQWTILDASQVMQLEAHHSGQPSHHQFHHHLPHAQQVIHCPANHQEDQFIFAPVKAPNEGFNYHNPLPEHCSQYHPQHQHQPHHHLNHHNNHHHHQTGCHVCLPADSYPQMIPITATISPRSIVRNVSDLRLSDEPIERRTRKTRRRKRRRMKKPTSASSSSDIRDSRIHLRDDDINNSNSDNNDAQLISVSPIDGSTSKELHNEIERKRRMRIKRCCEILKTMIPNVSRKTDKATILEQTVRYVKHTTTCSQNMCSCFGPYKI